MSLTYTLPIQIKTKMKNPGTNESVISDVCWQPSEHITQVRAKTFLVKVGGQPAGDVGMFSSDLGIEIFQRGSVGAAVSYKCTDDNKYRRRRAVKSNRLRL